MGFSKSQRPAADGAPSKRANANRANAQRSTGPRTPEGKAKSSMNAVKHGLTAQTAVLPGESREELESLARSVLAQLRPAGAIERLLAERVVSLAWKLRRCAAAEEDLAGYLKVEPVLDWYAEVRETEEMKRLNITTKFRRELPPEPGPRTGAQSLVDEFLGRSKHKPMHRLTEYELKLEAALRRSIHELRQIRRDENFAAREEEETPAGAPTDVPAAQAEAAAAPAATPPAAPSSEPGAVSEPGEVSAPDAVAVEPGAAAGVQIAPRENEPMPAGPGARNPPPNPPPADGPEF